MDNNIIKGDEHEVLKFAIALKRMNPAHCATVAGSIAFLEMLYRGNSANDLTSLVVAVGINYIFYVAIIQLLYKLFAFLVFGGYIEIKGRQITMVGNKMNLSGVIKDFKVLDIKDKNVSDKFYSDNVKALEIYNVSVHDIDINADKLLFYVVMIKDNKKDKK